MHEEPDLEGLGGFFFFRRKIKEALLVQRMDTVGYNTLQYSYCGLNYL